MSVRVGVGLLVVLAASCGASPRIEPSAPAEPTVAASAQPDDPIQRATEQVSADALRATLTRIVGPREVIGARAHHDAVADFIAASLREVGCEITRQPVEHGGQIADNIVAERVGRDPSRIVLIGAHYDTVPGTPGADDNASGVAVMLAIAHAIRDVPTNASVRFVAFAFEEDGLIGSSAYVSGLGDDRDRHEIAIVLDMVGYRSSEEGSQRWPATLSLLPLGRNAPTVGDFIGAYWLTDTPYAVVARFQRAARYAGELPIRTLALPRFVTDVAPDVLRGDHAPFWQAQIPAIAVGDTGDFRNPHYHGPSDTLETLDLEMLHGVATWLTAAVLILAEL